MQWDPIISKSAGAQNVFKLCIIMLGFYDSFITYNNEMHATSTMK